MCFGFAEQRQHQAVLHAKLAPQASKLISHAALKLES